MSEIEIGQQKSEKDEKEVLREKGSSFPAKVKWEDISEKTWCEQRKQEKDGAEVLQEL